MHVPDDRDTFSLLLEDPECARYPAERHDLRAWLGAAATTPRVLADASAFIETWRPDGAPPGFRIGRRAESTSALVLDYDWSPEPSRRINLPTLAQFFRQRAGGVLFTSRGHTYERPACHVVLPLTRRIDTAQLARLVESIRRETRQASLPDFDKELSLEWSRAPLHVRGRPYTTYDLGPGRLAPETIEATPTVASDDGKVPVPHDAQSFVLASPGHQTLAILRPHLVADRAACIEAWRAIADAGFHARLIKRRQWRPAQVKLFYAEHVGRDYYPAFEAAMCEGPAEALLLEADDAVRRWRTFLGATDPLRAQPGTFRARFGRALPHNAAHGSDSHAAAQREIAFCFAPLDRAEA